jgi:hypothetical protein
MYCPLQFLERGQQLIRAHDEPLPIAMRINDPDYSPFTVNGGDPAQTESGLLEVTSD